MPTTPETGSDIEIEDDGGSTSDFSVRLPQKPASGPDES